MADATTQGEKVEALHKGAAEVEKGAQEVKQGAQQLQQGVDHRNQLAADRTVFAAERTYAAWVRTGMAALASGVGAKKVLEGVVPEWMILATGSILVLFSAFSFGAAVWRQMNPGPPPPVAHARHIHPALLVTLNGFLIIVALAALMSIWFGRTGGD
jgi:putative membrane protein